FAPTEADQLILTDKSYYRVFNIQGTMAEARTSYYHHSIGGYHGVKIKRYQELYDSCMAQQLQGLIQNVKTGKLDFREFGAINMLNAKYLVYGEEKGNVIPNPSATGNAWFVGKVIPVNSALEELHKVCEINTRYEAVINDPAFKSSGQYDSASTITLLDHNPKMLKYESQSSVEGLAVFSEIYYAVGWTATIDGKEVPIHRVDYVLRAINVPSGKHTIEFRFEPAAYTTGNKITTIFSWLLIVVMLGSIGWSLRKDPTTNA
ncbi:MAG: YfhO family protein, partial [Chryseolinea sp.]